MSPWPVLVALSLGALAPAVVWWSNDQSNGFAIGLLVLAFATVLSAAGGWVWDVSRSRRPDEADGR